MSDSLKISALSVLLILSSFATYTVQLENIELSEEVKQLENKPIECIQQQLEEVPKAKPVVIEDVPKVKPVIEDIHYGMDKRGKCFAWSSSDQSIRNVDCKYVSHTSFSH